MGFRDRGPTGATIVGVRFRIVDVFSDRPLAGNALCVVLDGCTADRMQDIAREVNLSETTFPTVLGPVTYRNRIFTPNHELPFAGHPSLGTAWVLGPNTWEQTTAGAVVTIEADAHGAVMTQPDPELAPVDPAGATSALGLDGIDGLFLAVAAGNRMLFALTERDLAAARPDPAAIGALQRTHDATALGVVRRRDDRHLHVRVFAPLAGILEDPGTGAAAGPIGVLARQELGTDVDVTIRQGDLIDRPCTIEVHAEDGALRVGGAVAACAEGRFLL
jgi:trans-2,3-dihydro-3-hydroxyanthranilate isomerase